LLRIRVRGIAIVRVSVAAGALLLICGSSGAGASSNGSCEKPRGYVVAAKTHEAVVFRRRFGYRAYGCLRRRGKLVRLFDAVGNYKLARRYVAYLVVTSDSEGTFYRVIVRDLRTEGFRHIEAAYSNLPEHNPDDGEVAARITDLTLKRNGSVAWISCPPSDPNANHCAAPDPDVPYEVWRVDRRGRKLLDHSSEIELRSLIRKDSTISWRRAGAKQSATMK
jgi:hypothetical protein